MKKIIFSLSIIIFLFLAVGINAACTPPYTGYIGCGHSSCPPSSSCPYCIFSTVQNSFCCYSGTNVGTSCTTSSGQAGTCNGQGTCVATASCSVNWVCTSWSPVASPSTVNCGGSVDQTRNCTNVNYSCSGGQQYKTETQTIVGTKCDSGKTCVNGSCTCDCVALSCHTQNTCASCSRVTYACNTSSCSCVVQSSVQDNTCTSGCSSGVCNNGSCASGGATCSAGDGCKTGCSPADPDCGVSGGATCSAGDGCKTGCSPADPDCGVSGGATCSAGDGCKTGCSPADPDCSSPTPGTEIKNPIDTDTFQDLIGTISNFIFWLALALAPLLYIVGGVMLITAGGDPIRAAKAKSLFLYTTIGLAVILFARGLVALLQSVLGVQSQ